MCSHTYSRPIVCTLMMMTGVIVIGGNVDGPVFSTQAAAAAPAVAAEFGVSLPASRSTLGDKERWTVRITQESCEVSPGKVITVADCVLKTSPDMFTRIVREKYTPSPAEFLAGAIKSNNIQLLFTFQKAFQLSGSES